MRYAVGAASIAAFALVWWQVRAEKPAAAAGSAASQDVRHPDGSDAPPDQLPPAGPAPWQLEPTPTVEDELEDEGEPLHYDLPTLADWIHPVPGIDRGVPLTGSQRFGAEREGVRRKECGRGHCGVDLVGPRGQPIVAVAWGTVRQAEHSGEGRGGKYVRIEHPDFVFTGYYHLDDIAPGIEVGQEVNAGDVIGTLGRSGIKRSAPHLHFSLEIPDGDSWRYLDPSPYLAEATVLEMFSYRERVRRRSDRDGDRGGDADGVSDRRTAPAARESAPEAGAPGGAAADSGAGPAGAAAAAHSPAGVE
jgi:murein DD-endopeptidase MepM/ murein hydrolase activator NlpD